MNIAKFVKEITVIDPDSQMPVELEVYKHQNGGMFAVDNSFLDQVARTDEEYDSPIIPDPLCDVEDDVLDNVLLMDDDNYSNALEFYNKENDDLPED